MQHTNSSTQSNFNRLVHRLGIHNLRWLRILATVVIAVAGVMLLLGRWPFGPNVAVAGTFTVNSTDNNADANPGNGICADISGDCTLRAAIQEANAISGADTINFSIGVGGHRTIAVPLGGLPVITEPIVIDGTTQPGFAGTPLIELNGDGANADGLVLRGGDSVVRGLIINRFDHSGIVAEKEGGNLIAGNYIGVDVTGTIALPNGRDGVRLDGQAGTTVGGLTAADRNVISGNGQNGVEIRNTVMSNRIAGNYIGTNAAGTAALGNGLAGVLIDAPNEIIGGGNPGHRNIISGNGTAGIVLIDAGSEGNLIGGNYIGTNAAGTAAIPNRFGVVIGDEPNDRGVPRTLLGTDGDGIDDATEGNVISGNLEDGVIIVKRGTTETRVAGNLIGTNAAGTAAVPNGGHGVFIRDNASGNFIGTDSNGFGDSAERNLISGNGLSGVHLTNAGTDFNRISGNLIGTNLAGTAAIPNGQHGVSIDNGPKDNFIGSIVDGVNDAGEGNLISGNSQNGVAIIDRISIRNRISGNSIFSNEGLGIDLENDGVTPNDVGDTDRPDGANTFQNFPVITEARQGASTIIHFTLNSTRDDTFRVEFFSSVTPDRTAQGQGQTFLGFQNVTTDGSGNVTSIFTATATVPLGQVITATATDPRGNTSEFSKTRIVQTATAVDEVFASAFRLQSRSQEVVALEWRTGFEIDNLGFNIYRDVGGKRSLVNQELIAGSALFAGRAALTAGKPYRWIDKNPVPNSHYWLEEIDLNGHSSLHGPIFAQAVLGLDAAEQQAESLTSSPSLDSLRDPDNNEALIVEGPPDALDQSARRSNRFSKAARRPQDPDISILLAESNVDPAGLPALKLAVSRDGWYRASAASLSKGTIDPANLRLFTQGAEVPIRIAPDGMVEFYGQGLDVPSSDQRIYWLFVGSTPGLRIPQSSVAPASQAGPNSFSYTVERRDRTLYFSALLNGDVENIFGPLINANAPTNQTLALKAVDTSKTASLEVTVQGVTDAAHSVIVSLGATQLGSIQFNGRSNRKAVFNLSSGALAEGNNLVALQSLNGSTDLNLVDRVRITYARFYRADENQLRFTVSANQSARVNSFTDKNINLFDITDPLRVSELVVQSTPDSPGSFAISIPPSEKSRTFLAIAGANAGISPPNTLNQPSALKDRSHQADLLIISHRDFISSLSPLVELRRSQGLRVEVVDVEDVFDEFSFGFHSPAAIRDFLNWTRTQWLRGPRFVLLTGDSTWDPRNYLALGPADFVPTRLIDTALMETASDDWFVDFNSDGLPEMAVGRLPVRTSAQCDLVVKKLIAHDSAGPDPERKALFVADNGFQSINDELRALLPASLPVQFINRGGGSDAEVRAQILAALNSGPRLVNYTGHGSVTVWTGAGLLNSADAPTLTNSNRLPLMLMLTCLNSYSHDANIQSLGEALLLAPNGASAVWGSTGMTFPEAQRQIAVRLFQQLPAASGRIGEIMMVTKSATADLDVRRTWILLGDPSMQFRLVP